MDEASLPNCVFAPPGGGPRTLYGLSPRGELIHIERAERGAGNLVCPDCGGALVARKGDIRIPHFSHTTKNECTHAGETALHRIAKEIIASGKDLLLPASEVQGLNGIEVMYPATRVQFDAVDVEVWEEGLRPDLIGTASFSKDGNSHTRRMIIEIRVTHKVEAKKIAMLKQRGESVLEIDLSKVDRGLDMETFSEMVLERAPRQWLYHRIIEEREREIASARVARDRIRDRKRAYAVSMSEKEAREREEALMSSPVRGSQKDLSWADDEWRRWTLVNHGEFLLVPAQDGMFDVAPPVWRAAALQIVAPWCEGRPDLPFRPNLEKISGDIGRDLRRRGWVKAPFAKELTTFRSGRKQEWDPVGEEVYAFLNSGFIAFRYTMSFAYDRGDIEVAGRAIQAKWSDIQTHIGNVLHLSDTMEKMGYDLCSSGKRVARRDDVERALLKRGGVLSVSSANWSVRGLARWMEGGRSLKDVNQMTERLFHLGYTVQRRRGRRELSADAFARVLEATRVREWEAELKEWIREQAEDLLSVFLSQIERMPVIRPALGAEGFGFLCVTGGIVKALEHPLKIEEGDPVFAAKAEVEKKRKIYQRVAWELSRIADLADGAGNEELAEFIRGEGIAVCLRYAAGRSQRHVRGLHRQEDLEAAARMVAELERLSVRRKYGDAFPRLAMKSKAPEGDERLLDLVFAGEKVAYRKIMAGLRTVREWPKWVTW